MKKILLVAVLALLSACDFHVRSPDLVLGIALGYEDGKLVDAEVLGQAKSMGDCHKIADATLAIVPHEPGELKIACVPVYL